MNEHKKVSPSEEGVGAGYANLKTSVQSSSKEVLAGFESSTFRLRLTAGCHTSLDSQALTDHQALWSVKAR